MDSMTPLQSTGDQVNADRLLGTWEMVCSEGDIDPGEGVSATFSPEGTLRYAIRGVGKLEIMALTYEVRGSNLITDQPSKPKRETTAFWFDGDGRLVLKGESSTSWFVRSQEGSAA